MSNQYISTIAGLLPVDKIDEFHQLKKHRDICSRVADNASSVYLDNLEHFGPNHKHTLYASQQSTERAAEYWAAVKAYEEFVEKYSMFEC